MESIENQIKDQLKAISKELSNESDIIIKYDKKNNKIKILSQTIKKII